MFWVLQNMVFGTEQRREEKEEEKTEDYCPHQRTVSTPEVLGDTRPRCSVGDGVDRRPKGTPGRKGLIHES